MKGLLYKEAIMLKTTIRMQFLSLVIFMVLGFVLKNMAYMGMMLTVLCGNLCLSSLNYDMADFWNSYAATFPVRRERLISVKFVLQYLLIGGSVLLVLVLGIPFSQIMEMSYGECAAVAVACGAVSLLSGSLNLLLCTKFGVEKARVISVLTYLLPFGILMCLYYFSEKLGVINLKNVTDQQAYMALAGALAVIVALSLLFWRLSCRIFRKQDL